MTAQTIWGQATNPAATTAFTGTLATEFSLSQAAPLTGIWYYSPAAAASLATACVIYDVASTNPVGGTLNSSPTWSGAVGSGWVKCSYGGSITLNASQNYAVAVYLNATVGYTSGFTWPVLSGIIDATAALNTAGGSITYPATNAGTFSYFIDVEVSPAAPPPVMYQMRMMP